jgi:hypothetical protein
LIVFDRYAVFTALFTAGVSILSGIVEVNGLFDFIRFDGFVRCVDLVSAADATAVGIFNPLHTDAFTHRMKLMATSRSTRGASKPEPSPKTVQRTYRFDNKTFAAFEDDCAQHLSNPKRVIEALILHWLDASAEERAAMAQIHRQRIGAGSQDEE